MSDNRPLYGAGNHLCVGAGGIGGDYDCPCHTDPQCDGLTNVLDVVAAVNVAFRGTPATTEPNCPYQQTDADCDGVINVLDVVLVVNCAFRGNCVCACSPPTSLAAKRFGVTAEFGCSPPVESGTAWSIEISGTAPSPWIAAQFEFEDVGTPSNLSIEPGRDAADLVANWHVDGSHLTVGLIDIYGEHMVEAGDRTVLRISGEGPRPEITLVSGLLATEDAQPIEILPVTLAGADAVVPTAFGLGDNYPNPFNAGTIIPYAIAEDSPVRLEVFNVLGRRVVNLIDEYQAVGRHQVAWDGRNDAGNSSGIRNVLLPPHSRRRRLDEENGATEVGRSGSYHRSAGLRTPSESR